MNVTSAIHSGKWGWSPQGQLHKLAGLTGAGKPKPAEANKMIGDTPIKLDGDVVSRPPVLHTRPVLNWSPPKKYDPTPKPVEQAPDASDVDLIVSIKFKLANADIQKMLGAGKEETS